jgi:hypothetical protein
MEESILVKNMLVESADKLVNVSETSIKEYVENMDLLVATLNGAMLKREDILELIGGKNNITMMKNNHHSHLQFIAAILQVPDSEMLVDTLLWVFRAFMSRGFGPNYWEVQISTLTLLMKENVSEKAFIEISNIYNWMNSNINTFTMIADEQLGKSKIQLHG